MPITVSPSVYQAVPAAAIPIVAKDPPPEGRNAVQITYNLTSANPSFSTTYALATAIGGLVSVPQGGLGLSQVRCLVIQNTGNQFPLTVTHGALNQVEIIPPGATATLPTFSSYFNYEFGLSVSGVSGSISVPVTFLNFERSQGIYNPAAQQSQNYVQYSSAAGSKLVNLKPIIINDQVWNQNFSTTGTLTLASPLTGQSYLLGGYAINLSQVFGGIATNMTISLGHTSGGSQLGQWVIATPTAAPGITTAFNSPANIQQILPAGHGLYITLSTTSWTNGSVQAIAYGAILPVAQ
jgi:hypothetical protein